MRYEDLLCSVDTARDDVAAHEKVNGIDFVEIVTEPESENQRVLWVNFIPKSSGAGQTNLGLLLDALHDQLSLFNVSGGVRVREIETLEVKRVGDRLRIRVDQPGDFSDYRLAINHTYIPGDDLTAAPPKLHPAYSSVDFNFKAGCPSHFDCRPDRSCPHPPALARPVDYMARDYASFRQALFDLIPTLHPNWIERSPADVGTALIELMAYAADHLSYYQDAVANEAYLATARQRISVRRHARLIDYAMHDGVSARVFLHIEADSAGTIADRTQLLTLITTPIAGREPAHPTVIGSAYVSLESAARAAHAVFEVFGGTQGQTDVDPRLNELDIYDWRRGKCCLPRGTTRADVIGEVDSLLQPGDLLLFEEKLDPETLNAGDADPTHRQVVRLVSVAPAFDPLAPSTKLTRLVWHDEDALTFPLCVRAKDINDATVQIGVARGNILLADHGRTIAEEWHPEEPLTPGLKGIEPRAGRAYRFFLNDGPLSFRIDADRPASVATMSATDPHVAQPQVKIEVKSAALTEQWFVEPTLLSSGATSPHFVVETDNDGRAMIRFGDGTAGMAPPDDAFIKSSYRVGVGTAGNVAGGTPWHILRPDPAVNFPDVLSIRNPLPSWGGIGPEDLDEVRLTAPAAMRTRSERAVTEDDYALAAMKHPSVSKAVATFRWTGTWHTVFVTIDPKGRGEVTDELQDDVRQLLDRYSQLGYDIEIDPPAYVPIEMDVEVCVAPGHFRSDVEAAVLAGLSSKVGGFFHPDRFTFAQPLYLSQVYAVVGAVEGVSSAEVTSFHRYGDPPAGELERGAITVGRTQVVRLDNDPNFPDNGILRLDMRSGK